MHIFRKSAAYTEWAHSPYSAAGYLASTGNEWICCGRKWLSIAVSLCLPHPYRWQGAGGREWRPVTPLWAARRCPLSLSLHGCLCHYLHSARFLFMCWGTFLQTPYMCSLYVCAVKEEASRIKALVTSLIHSLWEKFSIQRSIQSERAGTKTLTGQRFTFHYEISTWILPTES